MLTELQTESKRQERSISWLIQQAWRMARLDLARMPGTTDYLPAKAYAETAETSEPEPKASADTSDVSALDPAHTL